ncbi:MAG: anti-sigma factor family protein [Actinomycetota bacterium]
MTCDEVRELLPEHLLGTLDGPEDLEVRRHLRGCAGCRTEMTALSEGVEWFARAAHDRTPPPELHDRVVTILEQEWRDADAERPDMRRARWLGRAAALVVVVVTLGWGLSQTHRANVASADAESYHRVLSTLGGKEFRIGTLDPHVTHPFEGSVVLYDSHQGQSWGIVLVRAPGVTGTATVTLSTTDRSGAGRTTIDAGRLEFQPDGDAATWLVTSSDLTPFDRVTITAEDGTVLATADIELA